MSYKEEREQFNIELQHRTEYLLNREMERLRKKCFKHKRQVFINKKISIHLLKEAHWKRTGVGNETYGYCSKIRDKDGSILEYRIILPKEEVRMYLDRFDYEKGFVIQRNVRENNPIVTVIRHELTHAFVNEMYEKHCKVIGINRDSSPIFLYHLAYFNGAIGTGYPSQVKMREMLLSDEDNVYKEILKLNYDGFKEQAINPTIKNLNNLVDSIGKYAVIEFTSNQEEPVEIEPERYTIKIGSEYIFMNDIRLKEVEAKFKQYFVEVQKNLKAS